MVFRTPTSPGRLGQPSFSNPPEGTRARTEGQTFGRAIQRELATNQDLLNGVGLYVLYLISFSSWPVRTGFSKTSFGYRIINNDTIQITNDAFYAQYVEERTGIIARTIAEAEGMFPDITIDLDLTYDPFTGRTF